MDRSLCTYTFVSECICAFHCLSLSNVSLFLFIRLFSFCRSFSHSLTLYRRNNSPGSLYLSAASRLSFSPTREVCERKRKEREREIGGEERKSGPNMWAMLGGWKSKYRERSSSVCFALRKFTSTPLSLVRPGAGVEVRRLKIRSTTSSAISRI